jgi:hypothetical protein
MLIKRKSFTELMLEKTINHNDKFKFVEEMNKLKNKNEATAIY